MLKAKNLIAAAFGAALSGGALAGELYAKNTEEAVRRGVFGAPFYILGEERFWGQDRLDDLELALAGGPTHG